MDATHILGLVLATCYIQAVRWLHQRRGVPIIPAIAVSAFGYCLIGTLLAASIPRTVLAFWAAVVGAVAFSLTLLAALPYRSEPGSRTTLPLWIKWPIMAGIILFLVFARNLLQGFATVFPIMGILTAYEARRSLWTVGRQAPAVTLTVTGMIVAVYLLQPHLGLGLALVLAWALWLILFAVTTWRMRLPTGTPEVAALTRA